MAAHLHKIAAPADLPPLRFLLTFGDGPSIRSEPNPTSQVLKTLASNPVQPGIKAIFFVQTRTANGGGTPQGHELMQRELADSNIGYALIGMAIEARAGRPLNALLAEKVLAPLGLHHTVFVPGNAHRAQGHAGAQPYFMPRGRPVADWRFPPAMQSSAALYASTADLLDFAIANLRADEHLHELLADNLRVRRPQPQDAPGIAWVTDDFDGIAITNQVGMAVVVLQTSFNWNFKIGHKLLLLLLLLLRRRRRLVRGRIAWQAEHDNDAARRAPIIATQRWTGSASEDRASTTRSP